MREAAMKIRTEQVDAQALRIGYRSRTNLYSAFRRVIGMSLTTFSEFPEERALLVLESIGTRSTSRDTQPIIADRQLTT